MNASTRKCTETRYCNLINCYACRRRLIDETATAMLDAGVPQEQVDQYRYPAINALACEITPPAPKTSRARKAPATVEPELIEGTLKALRACTSRDSARAVLRFLRVTELRAVAKALELGACSRYRKEGLVEHLINFTVQMKLDHDAILNFGKA